MMAVMREWFATRALRERLLLLAALVTIVMLVAFRLIFSPLLNEYTNTRKDLSTLKQDVAWMGSASAEIRSLSADKPQVVTVSSSSLPTAIDQSALITNIRDSIKRVEPQGEHKAQLAIEQADFSNLIRWIEALQISHGVQIDNITIKRQANPGRINANIQLQRGAQ